MSVPAPRCPKGCGPFGMPFDDVMNEIRCGSCGHAWYSEADFTVALRSQVEFDTAEESKQRKADAADALKKWNEMCATAFQ